MIHKSVEQGVPVHFPRPSEEGQPTRIVYHRDDALSSRLSAHISGCLDLALATEESWWHFEAHRITTTTTDTDKCSVNISKNLTVGEDKLLVRCPRLAHDFKLLGKRLSLL